MRVENPHKFAGFGEAGLAYTLGMKQESIAVFGPEDPGPRDRPVLVVPAEGNVRLIPPELSGRLARPVGAPG